MAYQIGARRVRFAVLDASRYDEALVLGAGRLAGSGVPTIMVLDEDSRGSGPESRLGRERMHSRIRPWRTCSPGSRPSRLSSTEQFPQVRIQEELMYQFWFRRGTSTICVVCPQIHEAGEYAQRSNSGLHIP